MSRSDRIMVAALGVAGLLASAAGWILLAPPGAELAGATQPSSDLLLASMPPTSPQSVPSDGPTVIVVDVQGGVAEPGVRELRGGSRVADAIAAAGGYSADVDLPGTAASINLAQPLTDGQQIRVPRIGDAAVAAGSPGPSAAEATGPGSAGTDGTVNLNTASPEELEALPGIGPVTVQKIVAARQEQPFSSLDDAVQRGVIHRGQLEDIQGLATAG